MPPRFAYWTIIVDEQPTAFRAKEAEELLPTFNRLKEKHPSAVMMWFQGGKLWRSRLEAQDAAVAARREEARKKRPADQPPRDRKWRPGGTHQDPRQKYKDARKAKWTRYKERVRAGENPRPPGKPVRPPEGAGDPRGPRPPDRAFTPRGPRPPDRAPTPRGSRPPDRASSPRGPRPQDRPDRASTARGPRPPDRAPTPRGPRPPDRAYKPRGPRPHDRRRKKGDKE